MIPLFEWITGKAGSGKSYTLQQMAKEDPSCVLTSTTGISAVNLGAGTTINSLLWFFNDESLLDAWTTGKLDYRLGEVYGKLGVRRICLDEISMCNSSTLSIICLAIDRLNETLARENKPLLGFTVAGDVAQLPPINGEFFFESEHWGRFAQNTTRLTKMYRQDDLEFLQALNWVREGVGKPAADYFCNNMYKLGSAEFRGTTLYPYNAQVDRHNAYRLEYVKGSTINIKSHRTGKPRPEWKYIPGKLILKEGALVMLLANRYEGGRLLYCNGDLGDVVSLNDDKLNVKLQRTGNIVEVEKVTRNNEGIVDDKKKIMGSITYSPVRLAFASTTHKVQGLTLDSVQVDFRSKFFKECPGMLYVALSRCRTKDGLRLIGSPRTFVKNCVVNPKVREFL